MSLIRSIETVGVEVAVLIIFSWKIKILEAAL
jgi:hypothetical protein